MDKFISLFEYLGKAAGTELGLEVYKKAVESNEPISYRNVTTAKYSGKVKLYRTAFLSQYFNPSQQTPEQPKPTDDLPF
jgi:hypothetical protein